VGTFIRLLRSSVGARLLAAASGVPLAAWVVAHAAGNLTLFAGPAAADGYAASLRALGPLLWVVRAGVLVSAAIHVAAVVSLARRARAARPVGYAASRPRASTFAGRSMRAGGALLTAFVLFHLLHLTFGALHPAFVPGQVHANVVTGLRAGAGLVAAVYVVAALALGLHLYHGLWSVSRSLGLRRASARRLGRPVAGLVAAALALAFASIPLAVVAGVLR
jgi:succinate dehydrogenase / fumarate reductase, cytochrome b subunit